MLRFLGLRVAGLVVTMWGIVTGSFFLFRLVPGSPAVYLAGADATPSAIAALSRKLGLDRALYVQYFSYLNGLVHGQFGTSVVFGNGLASALFTRYPVTVELAFEAMAIAIALGVVLGVVSALRSGSTVDHALMGMIVSLGGLPNFWLGVMLIAAFATGLHLFPVSGGSGFTGSILADVTLAAYPAAVLARLVRSSMLEVLSSGFIVACRARGLTRWSIVVRHALRNALVPAFTMSGLLFGYLLGGSIVVEDVFAKQGMGLLLLQSVDAHDYAMIEAITILFSASFLLLNLLADVGLRVLDPRAWAVRR